MTTVRLKAGKRAFYAEPRGIEPNSVFDEELAIAADLVAQGRATPIDESTRAFIAEYCKQENARTLARIQQDNRRTRFRVA